MRKTIVSAVVAILTPAIVWAQAPPNTPPAPPAIAVGDPGPTGVRIETGDVFANFFPIKGSGRGPAVLLLGGSEGGLSPGDGGMIGGLRDAGFNVLYLCYFGCPGTPPRLTAVPLETFDRALAFLRAQPNVDPKRIAVVGGSKGGEAALLVGARDPKLRAVVAAMPSSVAWPSADPSAITKSSWTANGAPVPFLPYALGSFGKGGVFAIYNDALPTLPQHADAVIPVERIAGSVLLVCGEADKLWPSCPMADQVAERLKANGRPAATVLHYKDAGHQVFGTAIDKTSLDYAGLAALGGTADGNAAARADSWSKAMAFLKAALSP